MRDIQLFIKPFEGSEYMRVDLFADETISMTQTIKNAKDVDKIFTDFTKSFTIPASKNNNSIFRHYENYSIDNGFDARKRVDARIEINSIPFKSGRVKLDGVDMRDDKAYAYRITFFGNTIKIKDNLGEDELSSLQELSVYDTTYSAAAIKTGLQSNPALENIIVPLITHSQRLTYGSGLGANSGDLKPDSNANHGLFWSELKYAIRVDTIVQAILNKAGVTLSNDSFFNSSNANYYNLFMWLHRKSGDIQSEILSTPEYGIIDGFSGTTDPNQFTWIDPANRSTLFLDEVRYLTGFTLRIDNPTAASYNVAIYRDGAKRIERLNVTDTTLFLNALGEAKLGSTYQVFASSASSNDITFTWVTTKQEPFNPQETNNFVVTTGVGSGADTSFFITQQLPEMKIVDFLSGLFKMFNLVAELSEDNVLTVKTIDQFYAGGVFRDISQYVDNTSGSVDVATQYAEIEYRYVSSETILANQYSQLQNKDWGADKYNTEDNLREGETFTFEIPFEHMQFERLPDVSSGNPTPIMYGYYVDDNQDPYIGAPLLFYPILNPLGSVTMNYVTGKDGSGNFNTVETITGSIIVPSNSITLDGANAVVDNLHFFLEDNEYELGVEFYKTLFYNYHYNYIASLFNFRNRLTKINAILPVPILVNYSLADTLTIQGNRYRINSIDTNLNTGESTLELLNFIPAYTIDGAGSAGGTGGGVELGATLSASISGETEPLEGSTHIYTSAVVGTATGITSYNWSVSNGGTIVGSNTNANVQISWAQVSQNSIRTINLTVSRNNDGDPKTFITAPYYVVVQDSAAPPEPTPLSIDILQSGGTPNDAVAEGAQRVYDAALYGDYDTPVTYTWAADGGTITSGQGTNRVFVTWNEVSGADYNGSISLTVVSNDGQTPPTKSYPVRVVDGTAAPYIDVYITNIETPVEIGYTTTYGTIIDSNITTSNPDVWSWSVTGGTINSGQFSSSINVTWDTEGAGSVSVSVVREGESGSDSAGITVEAFETTAAITGDFSSVTEGVVRTYGSSIGGNTTGAITYSWSVSKGEITGGSYDGNGNSVITGVNIPNIQVTWGTLDIGTGSINLTAVRQGYEGVAPTRTIQILGTYYLFTACDGGETVVSRQVSDPPFCDGNGCRRYANYAVNPIEYYVYADSQVNSPAGFTEIGLQPVTDGGSPTYGCPTPEPPPVEDVNITGPFSIDAAGENGVVYDITTVFNTTGWQVTKQALSGFNPINLTFVTSTSGTGDGSVTVNFGPYNGDGTETLRSQIVVTTDNVTPQVSGTVEISQGPPPPTTYYIMTPCDPVNWGTVMIESVTAPSANQRAEGGFSNYYTYSGNTTTDPNAYSIASLTLLATTGCPPPPSCTRYQATNEGSGTVYFLYTDCTSGGSRLLNVAPNETRSVCAKTNEFDYASGDTNYTIVELGPC